MKVTRKRKRLMWLMITSIAFLRLRKRRKAGRCSRRTWVRSIFRHRLERSEMKLVEEMRATNDIEPHISYLRMSPRCFEILLQKIRPFMPRRRGYRSMIRPNVSPKEALVMTLRFLATGASQRSLSFSFWCAPCTVREAILETCRAIWDALNGTVLRFPKDG